MSDDCRECNHPARYHKRVNSNDPNAPVLCYEWGCRCRGYVGREG